MSLDRNVKRPSILVAWLAAALMAAGGGASHAQVLAFPEAEGFGRFATGARTSLSGASVYHVTNLNDSGAGSFRDAVSQSNRFVVFDVGGVVTLGSVAVVSSNVTIAGQTAPGGIAFYGDRLAFTGANNTISRYIAVRKGEAGTREDSVSLSRGTNMIFDHMSVTWGVDETFSMNPDSGYVIDNITIQNTVIAQGLDRLGHSAGGLMTLGEGSRFSVIKSLFADNVTRNPKVRGENEYINNVVYGYETAGYIMGDTVNMTSHANAIGNYFIEGPVDGSSPFASGTPQFEIYGSDNWVDANRNGVLDGSSITTYPGATVAATPFAFPTAASMTAQQAVGYVTQNAGPTITRDEVDTRIMQEVLSYGTLGGVIQYDTDLFPTFSSPRIAFGRLADADNDGMPDGWERSRGLNPASSTDWKNLSGGYTNLELYLNELGANETTSRWTAASGTWGAAANWSGGLPTFATAAAVTGTTAIPSGQSLTRRLAIGDVATSQITVSGGTLDVFERLHLGSGADATLSLTAGTVAAGEIVLGGTSGATATSGVLAMTGGTLQAASVRAGSAGGRFDWGGGTVQFTAAPNVAVSTVVGMGGGSLTTNGFSGTWSGVLSGSGGLTKNGTGTLALSGSNTMAGGVRVTAGTLAVNHIAAIGSGSIALAGGNVTFGSVSGIAAPIALLSSGTLTAGGITLNGPISGGGGVRLALATSAAGSSNLTLAGGFAAFTGTVDFNATTGNVRLNSTAAQGSGTAKFDLGSSTATLRTAYAATVALGSLAGGTATKLQGSTNDSGLVTYVIGANAASTTFSGTITDGVFTTPGGTGMTKVGAGTLVLGGAASSYTGVTRISGGVLSVGTLANGGAASGIGQATADPANLVLDGGTLQYTGGAVTVDRGFTVTANGGTIERNGSGNLVLGGTADIVMSGTGGRTFTLSGTATSYNNISAGIADPASGQTTFVKAGAGTWRLFGGSKTYSGDTLVNGGTLFLVSAGVLPTGAGKGDVTVAAGATLELYGNSHTINGLNGAGTVTTSLNTSRTLTIGNGDADGDFSGLLTQGTAQSLAITKTGSGTQRFGRSSSYTGATSLRGGTLVAAATDALGTGVVTITGSARRLVLTGSALVANGMIVNAPTGAADGGVIQYDGPGRGILAGGTITVFAAPANGGLLGSSGGGELVVNAAVAVQGTPRVSVRTGTVTFGGGGTYSGLDVMAGTVRLGRTDGLATGAAVTIGTSGTGTFDLTGFSQTVAGIAQGAGAAVIGNSSTTQDAVLTLTGNSTYDGTIRDALGGGSRRVFLAVNGGNLRLTGANTFSGTSSVAAGTLQVGHAAALAASPAAVLSGGTLTVDAGLSMQTPSLTIAAGGLARLPSSAATTLATSWLAIDGRLDVGVGRLEIAAGGITEDSLLAALVAGRGDGTWTGTTGITSSSAAVDLAGGIPRSVGWIADGDASFSAAYTAPGDANVDGQVDILDAANFISGGLFDNWQPAVWSQGDFNYDGVVDILDAADLLGTSLFDQGPFVPTLAASEPGAIAVVPEPAGLPWLALVACVGVTMRRRFVRAVVVGAACVFGAIASAATLHVAPRGDDAAAGTAQAPLASVQAAVDRAQPGDMILLNDGVFPCRQTILLSGSGTGDHPIRLLAAPKAKPVLEFAGVTAGDEKQRAASRGVFLTGDHWILEGLEIRHAADNGLKIEGSHNRVERCVFHHNGDSGLQIGLAKKSKNDGTLAAHNTIVNCDSYRNFDARTKGENADGFACKLFPGEGNSFVGCRAWENADDGWDLFMTTFPVALDRCWAWHNGDPGLFPQVQGSYNGDGNGFKLGGQDKPASHLVRRCVAFDHPFGSGNGFEDNNNTAPITLQHCTAWGNKTNFQFKKASHVLENCASFAPTRSKSGVAFDADVVCRGNSWTPDPNPKKKGKYVSTLAADEFTGLDATLAAATRAADGGLPENGFASPRSGGAVVDQGVDLGATYSGAAPDRGAVELDSEDELQKTARGDAGT